MSDCKVMIKAPKKEVKARFSDYEDMEFERRGDWTLAEDYGRSPAGLSWPARTS